MSVSSFLLLYSALFLIFCAEMKAFEILSCRPISLFYSEQEEHVLLYLSLFSISSRDSFRIEREREFEVGIEAGIGAYGCPVR